MKLPKIMKAKKAVAGFTLIELIFEIFVLAVLIIPTVIVLGQFCLNVVETETNTIATDLCIYKTEELLSAYNYVTLPVGHPVFSGNFSYVSPGCASYSYTVVVQYVDANNPDTVVAWTGPPAPEPQYKRAKITVSRTGIPDVVSYALFVKDIL